MIYIIYMVNKLVYTPITLYLKKEHTKKELKKIIVDFENVDEAINALIELYKQKDKPRFF